MNTSHLVITEMGFEAPNWRQGLENASIAPYTGGQPPLVADGADQLVVWVLSSVPGWERLVRHYSGEHPVIVLSKLTSLGEMQKALEAGARGYIEALANPVQLRLAGDTVAQGALWIAAPLLSRLLGIISKALPEAQVPASWEESLSKRERQVAELVARGLSNQDVAEQLNITIRTVKEHLTSIYAKLEISDRLQLVLAARKSG